MGLFSFTQEIAMDLGTANTIIMNNDKIVVDEPSVVALDRRTDKMIAVGDRAKLMYEKENPNIRTVRPLRDGVIADFNACEQMMRGLIKKVNTGRRLFTPSLRMVIGVPSGSTEVELRAVRDSAEHAGGRDVYLIFEPMAAAIGIGLQSFCIPGSVAENRKVGLGHGNLGAMLLSEETDCFCFLAGHESFAAAEGAIKIALNANKVRKHPLRVILNGLGKDAAKIISRINGFTYVETQFDYFTGEVKELSRTAYSDGDRAKVNCYGADDVREGVAIMHKEGVDVSITGNSTNPTRFQHPVAGTYKKECIEQGKKYFSVASGGGTGRTLHPDNMAAGPASYGMTDTMGRMHSDAQFAGSSSVPAHVEMMGLIGMGNNPMVGATVAVAVAIEEASK